jgi:hypothetical protein
LTRKRAPKAAKPEDIAASLSAQEKVILFCAAVGIDHAAVGILARSMQAMAIRGLIEREHGSADYVLTDAGRAAFVALLESAGIDAARPRQQ